MKHWACLLLIIFAGCKAEQSSDDLEFDAAWQVVIEHEPTATPPKDPIIESYGRSWLIAGEGTREDGETVPFNITLNEDLEPMAVMVSGRVIKTGS